SPKPCDWIVYLRRGERDAAGEAAGEAPSDEHFAIWQQRGAMRLTPANQRATVRPGAGDWIVQLGRVCGGGRGISSRHEDFAIGEQSGRGVLAPDLEGTGEHPQAGGRIVNLCGVRLPAADQYFAV